MPDMPARYPRARERHAQRAELFARLHRPGEPLLLPNAWDVASAVTIAAAGAKAIATTSAGVAWSLGVPDGAGLGAAASPQVSCRRTVGRVAAP
jgi:2-methylisocitrate lyase-like PEP mutase family enzyme